MKGIAMLAVMWGHISTFGFNIIYSFHMPVFFILSGLFFKNKETKVLLKCDFSRLIVPYIITCFLTIVLTSFFGGGILSRLIASFWGNGSSLNTAKYFSNIPNVGAIWFLIALAWCRLIFNQIVRLDNDTYIFLITCVIFITASIIGRHVIVMPFSILAGSCALPFFYYGYYSKRNNINRYLLILFVVVWIFCVAYSHMNIARCYFKFYLVDIIGGIGGYIVLMKVSSLMKSVDAVAKPLMFIGRNSIIYLCFHLIINMFFHISINTILFFVIEVIVCSLIVWLLSLSKITKEIFKINLKC